MSYSQFLARKAQLEGNFGFTPDFIPDACFPFQRHLIEWSVRKGRAALFEDCGLGKTLQQLAWAENVHRRTNKPILLLAPLGVGHQTVREGAKFGIEATVSRDGKVHKGITVTNYERLKYFRPSDFDGAVCDESSILKNFDGVTKEAITEFMRTIPYRLLCTATAAPNDYPELGTSSECLGEMGYMDMLSKFFKNDQHSNHPNRNWSGDGNWRFRGHAEQDFWRWVCSWARAVRKPSDLGFEDGEFALPPLVTRQHVVECKFAHDEFLFPVAAVTLQEQRQERARTLEERCSKAAELINATKSPAIAWSNLNAEGDMLERMIPGSIQVSGADDDEAKEEAFSAFSSGEKRVLVSKTSIAGFGLNFQHCAHQTFFPSHSFEQWYQGVRRSWRFGQKKPVQIDIITSDGETKVLSNLQRKAAQSEVMFSRLVSLMGNELSIKKSKTVNNNQTLPSWLIS